MLFGAGARTLGLLATSVRLGGIELMFGGGLELDCDVPCVLLGVG